MSSFFFIIHAPVKTVVFQGTATGSNYLSKGFLLISIKPLQLMLQWQVRKRENGRHTLGAKRHVDENSSSRRGFGVWVRKKRQNEREGVQLSPRDSGQENAECPKHNLQHRHECRQAYHWSRICRSAGLVYMTWNLEVRLSQKIPCSAVGYSHASTPSRSTVAEAPPANFGSSRSVLSAHNPRLTPDRKTRVYLCGTVTPALSESSSVSGETFTSAAAAIDSAIAEQESSLSEVATKLPDLKETRMNSERVQCMLSLLGNDRTTSRNCFCGIPLRKWRYERNKDISLKDIGLLEWLEIR